MTNVVLILSPMWLFLFILFCCVIRSLFNDWEPKHKLGEQRVKSKFLWLPKTLMLVKEEMAGPATYWFKTKKIRQVYSRTTAFSEDGELPGKTYRWHDLRWEND